MRHPSEEELVMLFYGEADGREAIENHLAECPECRAAYAELEAALAAVDVNEPPERPEDYGAQVWRRVAPLLPPGREKRRLWLMPAIAMAAMLVVAFGLGRFSAQFRGEAARSLNSATAPAAQVRERILMVAVGDHLERSQMVLLELVNTHAAGNVDISAEQARAQDLVASNRLYREAAARSGDTGVASVLDELERALLEIAHSPSKVSSSEFEELRKRVEAQGILFKVQVIDTKLRGQVSGNHL
jgi:predicted anti-sigma-YlaC factor YlaD